MSSRRTRKNSGSRRSNRSRTRTRKFNPLASIFAPPKKGYLEPIKSAERLIKKAGDLINAGPELPEPTPMKLLPLKKRLKHNKIRKNLEVDMIRDEANKELKRQQKLMPKPPSKSQNKTQSRRPAPRIRTTRKILPKKPTSPKRPSKSKSNTQKSRPAPRTTRTRTIVPKPPSKSQNKTQRRPPKRFVTEENRRTRRSKRLNDKRKKRNLMQKIKKNFAVQIENMEKPFKAAKRRERNPPKRYNP